MSNSRLASSPTTKKKNVIRPEFTQPRRLSVTSHGPTPTDAVVPQTDSYDPLATFAQRRATSAATSRTVALPVSVVRNRRNGVSPLRPHVVVVAGAGAASVMVVILLGPRG